MARLPQPGGDSGNWGSILNDYLSQVHTSDGTLKTNSVTSDAIAPNAVTTEAIAPNTIDDTVIADGSITNALIADGTIEEGKFATAVQTKLNQTAPVTSVASKTGDVTLTAEDVLPTQTGNSGKVLATNGTTASWQASAGDMLAATYDPANIAQQVVGTTATQTLTNKTLTDPKINVIKDTTNGLTSLAFASPASAVNYITVNSSATGLGVNLAATGSDGSINLDLNPKGSGQVRITGAPVVTTTGSATLSNKTLTSPKIASGDFIADANGNEQIIFTTTASAVNEITITNAATGNKPTIAATGGDTNVTLNFTSKGSGTVQVNGVDVVTTTGTQTLTNKTLTSPVINSPTGNIVTSIDGTTGAVNGVAKLVKTTGSTIANQWTRIATFTPAANPWVRTTLTLAVSTFYNQPLILGVNMGNTASGVTAGVEILARGSNSVLADDAFKIVNDGYGSPFELWVKASSAGAVISFYEIGKYYGSYLTYDSGTSWTATEPTGSIINTVSIAYSALTNYAKRVVKTAAGGTTSDNGANTWAKIATLTTAAAYIDINVMLAVSTSSYMTSTGQLGDSGIIHVQFKAMGTGYAPNARVSWLAKPETTHLLSPTAFKLVANLSDGGGTGELWVKKSAIYGNLFFYELNKSPYNSVTTVAYHDNAAWQADEPTGAAVNVFSDGLSAFGVPLVTITGTQTLTNKTLTNPTITGTSFIQQSISTVTTTATIGSDAATNYILFLSSGAVVTLPTAVGNTNLYTIKNIDTTDKTVSTTSSQTIDGVTTLTIKPNDSYNLVSDSANWRIV